MRSRCGRASGTAANAPPAHEQARDCAFNGRELQMKTHLDLFSGIGGFAIAAQACGYTTIGFCEKEKYAQQILKERFGAVLADAAESGCETNRPCSKRNGASHEAFICRPALHPDIFTLNGADYAGVDLLTGGFPCQPFSVAGKRKGAADERALWPEMLRVIDGAKPAWLIGENVAGIVTMELDNILSDLEGIGYAAWPLVIPACAVDARHRRDRVWIVAHTDSGRGEQCDKNERGFSKPDSECAGVGKDGAHANGALAQGSQRAERARPERAFAGQYCQWRDEAEWFAESGMGRVAHGIPHRAHRLRGLGNSIVPQVAYEIIRAIPPHIPGREIALATGAGMR
jgi:DNA (cytosine-5)-methyltransferase 1